MTGCSCCHGNNEGSKGFTAQRKCVGLRGIKTGGGIVLPGHCPQVAVEQLEQLELLEKTRNGGKRKSTGRVFSRGVVSKSVPPLFPPSYRNNTL